MHVTIGLAAGVVALAILVVLVVLPNGSTGPHTPTPSTRARALREPRGVAIAPDGAVYVADALHYSIRRVLPDGTIEPFAGPAERGGNYGDGGPAIRAELVQPRGIAVADGAIYIADYYHAAIRRIGPHEVRLVQLSNKR